MRAGVRPECKKFYTFFFNEGFPLGIIFETDGIDEAFHIMIDIKNEHVQRWAVVIGDLGEGTSIDFEEPFVIR